MFFFFNDTATTEIYTLSLHDALPIWRRCRPRCGRCRRRRAHPAGGGRLPRARRVGRRLRMAVVRVVSDRDRKSTRLNSSHANISYAVFCLKKKKKERMDGDHLYVG